MREGRNLENPGICSYSRTAVGTGHGESYLDTATIWTNDESLELVAWTYLERKIVGEASDGCPRKYAPVK